MKPEEMTNDLLERARQKNLASVIVIGRDTNGHPFTLTNCAAYKEVRTLIDHFLKAYLS